MPPHLSNLPLIVVSGEVDRAGNIAIPEFGARSCPDSETFDLSTSRDSQQVGGYFLSSSSDITFQLDDFSSFLASRQSFPLDSSPVSTFSDFDESPSSNYEYFSTPGTSPSIQFSELGPASPQLDERFIKISLRDPASPIISQSHGDAGGYLRPRRYSDAHCGGRLQVSTEAGHGRSISHGGSHRPAFDCSNDSHIIDRMPNVAPDNGLGLTFDPIYQGSATASGVGPSILNGQGVHSQPIATAGGEAPYTLDAGRLFFAEQRQPLYPHAPLPHPTISAAPNSYAHFRPPRPARGVQELPFGDHGSLRDSLKLQLPTDTSDGFCDGPYSAPASYAEDRAHFPAEFLTHPTSASREVPLPTDMASWKSDNPEPHCLSPLMMDASSGFSSGPCSAPASYTGERTFPAEFLMSQQSTSRERMNASSGSSGGPYSASASFTRARTHCFPAEFLTGQPSAPSHFHSFFEDDKRDPMRDTVFPAASSTTSGWPGETTKFPSCSKKTVSTAKLRKASAKRRKKLGRFGCPTCGSTFTEKHNLANHVNSHLGIKPFICDRCSRGFGVASSLKRHRGTCKGPMLT